MILLCLRKNAIGKTLLSFTLILAFAGALVHGMLSHPAAPADATLTEAVELPIVMYHHVLETGNLFGDYVISTKELERDFQYIRQKGYQAVLMQDLFDYVYKGKPLPEKPILITFDDGYESGYRYVFPLLQQYNMKAVISIIGYWSELYTAETNKHINYSHLTWEEIKQLQNSGIVEIQNHTYNLHTLDKRKGTKKMKSETAEQYAQMLKNDLGKTQELVEKATGIFPSTFTYPFGYVSKESFGVIREMGFKASLSCAEGINKLTRDPDCLYMLKRYNRPHGVSTQAFFDKFLKKN